MTASIPDGVSFSELQELAKNAAEPDSSEPTYGGQELTKEQLLEAVDVCFSKSMEICNDPLFHKLIVMKIIHNYIEWHTTVGVDHEDPKAAVHWIRDAGKCQAIMDILTSVNMGPADFITPID